MLRMNCLFILDDIKMSSIYAVQTTSPKYEVTIDSYLDACQGIIESKHIEWMRGVAEKLKIKTRQCVMDPSSYKEIVDEPVHKKFEIYKTEAKALVTTNLTDLFATSLIRKEDITHVIAVSCTGVFTPGLEHFIIDTFGLKQNTWCLGLNFMGCHGAMKGLYTADQLVKVNPQAKVLLVCVELCSLHIKKSTSKTTLIANSLFADGCASCVVGSTSTTDMSNPSALVPLWSLHDFTTVRVPNSVGDITWDMGATSFDMFMDKKVPYTIAPYVKSLFSKMSNVNYNDLNYCIHPGGVTIMECIAHVLGLSRDKLDYSYDVLSKHGNMSSCTVLFVLDTIRKTCKNSNDIAMIGAGPGITLEAFRLRPIKPNDYFTQRSITLAPKVNIEYTNSVCDMSTFIDSFSTPPTVVYEYQCQSTSTLLSLAAKYPKITFIGSNTNRKIIDCFYGVPLSVETKSTIDPINPDVIYPQSPMITTSTVDDNVPESILRYRRRAIIEEEKVHVHNASDHYSISAAGRRVYPANVSFVHIDNADDIPEDVSIVYSSLDLHTYTDLQIVDFLSKCNDKVTHGIKIFDFQRGKVPSCVWKACHRFGFTSVSTFENVNLNLKKGFTRDDLISFTKRAFIKPECVATTWKFPFIWDLTIHKECTDRQALTVKDRKDPTYNRHLFNVIAPKYDLLTSMSSCGVDSKWKSKMINEIPDNQKLTVLDLGTGTGGLALDISYKCARESKVTGYDISEIMIKETNKRKQTKSDHTMANVNFVCQDISDLKVADESVDCVTAGYAFSNFPNCDASLDTVTSAIKSGGKLIILDFYKPENKVWSWMWFLALWLWTSLIGLVLYGEPSTYNCMVKSIKAYVTPQEMTKKLVNRHYTVTKVSDIWFGAIAMHVATKNMPDTPQNFTRVEDYVAPATKEISETESATTLDDHLHNHPRSPDTSSPLNADNTYSRPTHIEIVSDSALATPDIIYESPQPVSSQNPVPSTNIGTIITDGSFD